MPVITHIALYTADLEKSKDYYTRFFAGKAGGLYQSKHNGFQSYFITFEGGARLELMHCDNLSVRAPEEYAAGWSHVAFSLGSEHAVLSCTQAITGAGYALYSPPRRTGDGYFESCVSDPDGNRVEITL